MVQRNYDPFSKKAKTRVPSHPMDYNIVGQTQEFCERFYFHQKSQMYSRSLMQMNEFWIDLMNYTIKHKTMDNFLSRHFIFSNRSVTELILVLSVLSLPFSQPAHQITQSTGKEKDITAACGMIVYTKEIKEAIPKLRPDIMIKQRFFDPLDNKEFSEEDPQVFWEKDATQFIITKIYSSQIILTNCSSSNNQLKVLHEIPEGALPVYQNEYTKSTTVDLNAYQSHVLEFSFYFPKPGKFTIYPANIAKDQEVYAVATEYVFEVKEKLEISKLETLNQVLMKGTKEDILKFAETKNIMNPKIFNFNDIYYLLKDKQFYLKFIEILKKKNIYNSVVYSYSVYHCHHETLRDFLNHEENREHINKYIKYIDSSLFKIPKNIGGFGGVHLQLMEYYPLVNSRVHMLKRDSSNILNNELKAQYKSYLRYLSEKTDPSYIDKLGLVYYLLLQDRINDALKVFKGIQASEIEQSGQLQYDYIAAYLDFQDGYPHFKVAREIIDKYLDYHVISWRNIFYEMANQIAEYDGEQLLEDDFLESADQEQKKRKENELNASKDITFEAKIEGKTITVSHKNLDSQELRFSYYIIDLEVFFSKKPFLSQISEDFGYLQPILTQQVKLDDKITDSLAESKFEVPQTLQKVNMYIQITANNKKQGVIYFSTNLKVIVQENYGTLKVTDDKDRPLSKVYVKGFIQNKQGEVNFYKDGYTDLRGKFDYLSTNSNQDNQIEKFSLFIMSDELGSLIKEVKVPQKLVHTKETVELRSKNWI